MPFNNLSLALIGISLLFFILLFGKSLTKHKKNFCVICVSVSLLWIILLISYYLNIFADQIIIAILMGHTSLGIFYLLYDKLGLFKLPFLLTTISLIYFVFEGIIMESLYLLAGIWGIFFIFKLFKNKSFSKKILECCKKW